ncbi:12281_t:CDS:1, partial [Ambispora gerdemannii]
IWATYVVYKIAKRAYIKRKQKLTELEAALTISKDHDSSTTLTYNSERHPKKIIDDDAADESSDMLQNNVAIDDAADKSSGMLQNNVAIDDAADESSGMLQNNVAIDDAAGVGYHEIQTAGNTYKPYRNFTHQHTYSEVTLANAHLSHLNDNDN